MEMCHLVLVPNFVCREKREGTANMAVQKPTMLLLVLGILEGSDWPPINKAAVRVVHR